VAKKRNLNLSNFPVEEALERFQDALQGHLKIECESVEVIDALDRVTGAAVFALCNSPQFNSAAMDGVAVISAGTAKADVTGPVSLKRGTDYLTVNTGDPVCHPYDAVIRAEDIQEIGNDEIVVHSAATSWQNVRPVGEDIVKGEMILPCNHIVRPVDIGAMLSGGVTRIMARMRPHVAVLPTGSEMVEPGDKMKEGGIIESNSRMLEALIKQSGGLPQRFATIPDEYSLLRDRLKDAIEQFDIVIVCSGASAGTEDYTVDVLRELGDVIVHGVAMKPGRPVILAVVNGKPVIGVPGYPIAAYLAYENFVTPILEAMSGRRTEKAPVVKAILSRPIVSSPKCREYIRVKAGRVGDRLLALPLARGAGATKSLVYADGFVLFEQGSGGGQAGDEVEVAPCRVLDGLDRTVVSAGSHDRILDVVADILPDLFPGVRLSCANVGSMNGLMALKSGETHIAPIHLLDEKTGEYNIPILKELFADRSMALIKGVSRSQGIMVNKGNPLGITGVEDLPRCCFVNRQNGSEARVFLDYMLKIAGIDPTGISGYEREAVTHMAAAAAVKDGSADAGIGILSTTKAMDLDFIPMGEEEYDFAIPLEFLELLQIRAFIDTLKCPAFLRRLGEFGGYTDSRCGQVILIER